MKNILLYGAGENCEIFLRNAIKEDIHILAIIDKNKYGEVLKGIDIQHPDTIQEFQYDEVFVTPRNNRDVIDLLVNTYLVPINRIKLPEEINYEYIIPKIELNDNVIISENIREESCFFFVFQKMIETGKAIFVRLLACNNSVSIPKVSYKEKLFIFVSFDIADMKRSGFFQYLNLAYPNSKKFLWICDPFEDPLYGVPEICNEFETLENLKRAFDYCYTYHWEDAKKYNLLFYPQFFPDIDIDMYTSKVKNDVFFVGYAKKRKQIIYDVYEKLSHAGLKCNFLLYGVPKNQRDVDGIGYIDEPLQYAETLKEVSKTKCILEVCNDYDETSLRFAEAVIFNKKLLVNDDHVKERAYYNERNIQVYHSVSEIDIGWISLEPQNYFYSGDFDTEYFFRDVLKILL